MSEGLLSLLAALREVRIDLSAEDVADALWLTPHLAGAGDVAVSAARGTRDAASPHRSPARAVDAGSRAGPPTGCAWARRPASAWRPR